MFCFQWRNDVVKVYFFHVEFRVLWTCTKSHNLDENFHLLSEEAETSNESVSNIISSFVCLNALNLFHLTFVVFSISFSVDCSDSVVLFFYFKCPNACRYVWSCTARDLFTINIYSTNYHRLHSTIIFIENNLKKHHFPSMFFTDIFHV